jgi:dTDP-4-dehydrorhamnose reductase
MRILITGADGQLGYELARELAGRGEVVATTRAALDLADPDAIVARVREVKPQLIVNAAAYTAVDRAESEPELAAAVNARAPGVLAAEAKRCDALLIHYSTDYVFDGLANSPYDEDAATHPLNVYGATKLAGEQAVSASRAAALTFRTSWVYGLRGRNFLLTMQKLARERDELRVVADQHGVPNWSRTLARTTATLVARGLPWLRERAGLYHMTSLDATTWHAFACAIVEGTAGLTHPPRVTPITTADYPTPARRPLMSALADARFVRTFGFALPAWREALREALAGS